MLQLPFPVRLHELEGSHKYIPVLLVVGGVLVVELHPFARARHAFRLEGKDVLIGELEIRSQRRRQPYPDPGAVDAREHPLVDEIGRQARHLSALDALDRKQQRIENGLVAGISGIVFHSWCFLSFNGICLPWFAIYQSSTLSTFDFSKRLPPIDLPSVPNRERQHDQPSVLNFADDPEIANTVAPQAAEIAFERLAQMARILAALDPVVQPTQDTTGDWLVQFPQLLLSKPGNLNGPGQVPS